MKLKNFDRIGNLTLPQQLMVMACLAQSKEEREGLVTEWEEQVVIHDIDFSSSRLIPYFFDGNQRAGISTRHDQRMKTVYKHWWLRTQHIVHQLKEVHAALRKAEIEVATIKGASIKMYYERDELRPMADFDLLIRPANLEKAMEIIGNLNYLPDKEHARSLKTKRKYYLDFFHAVTFEHQISKTQLDLHWRVGSRCSLQYSNKLWLHLQDYESVPGGRKPQLAYEVFMIVIHAVNSKSRDNLNWIIDISVINKRKDLSFWEDARKIAVSEKKEEQFDYGCLILIKFGLYAPDPGNVEVPRGIVSTAPKDRKDMTYIRLSMARMGNLYQVVHQHFPYANPFMKLYHAFRYARYKWF